ncbi:MAG: DNA polymerase III subunit gamma/tau [Bacteroidales bacterium]|nr:DNA polymerase III subunit gamma/tau [Bacteroidales bacterium]MBN2757487.1 DNA polymerase III subunit gamma/tau [Bacteroidales bacterium]
MDNFIVSARKYRPSTFNSVVGQASITSTLKNAIKNNHLAHAYLFCGPRGVGKTTCARIFAKTINCQNLANDTEACNECESCTSFNSSRSYNIHELDAASNNSVEDIRSLIDQVRIPPQIGKYSIYIIDEVHMLSSQAFNAFLKTLEEPPPHAIFILATTEKHKIIPTILSRCQIFDFNRITVEDISKHLEFVANSESIKSDPEALNIIAQKADGALRDALSYFDQIVSFSGKNITYEKTIDNLNVLDYDYYFRLIDAFIINDHSESFSIFNEILNKGFDGHHFINGLSKHIRDIIVSKDEKTIELIEVGKSIKEKYLIQAKKCTVPFLFQALNILNTCDLSYKTSQNKRLLVELALINLNQITINIIKQQNTVQNQKQNIVKSETKTEIKEQKNENLSSISIKDTLSNKQEIKKDIKIEEKVVVAEIKEKQTSEFTIEMLTKAWDEFAETIKSTKPRIFAILKANKPDLKEDSAIEFSLSNNLQEDAVIKIKNEIINYLTKSLNNNNIKLIFVIKEGDVKKQLYTDSDKYKYLTEKNENLNKLKQKFNLDF